VITRTHPSAAQLDAIASIQGWTRMRFKLDPAAAVLVSEVACRVPGCAPLETVVAFWTSDDSRHQFRLLKPLLDVRYDDVGWLFGTPSAHDPSLWSCC
jgi:nitrate reductase delta subunit